MNSRMLKSKVRILAMVFGVFFTLHGTVVMAQQPWSPTQFRATADATGYAINLSWRDRAWNESRYEIERSPSGGNGTYSWIHSTGANASSYTNSGLTPDTRYYYRLRACNGSGCSGWVTVDERTVPVASSSSSSSSSTSSSSTSSSSSSGSGMLDLADTALEVMLPVEPNILLLIDDSGSMDMGIMVVPGSPQYSANSGGGLMRVNNVDYGYAHPDPGATGDAPAQNEFSSNNPVMVTEAYVASRGVSSPYYGVWRAWNADYNSVYYNGDITYVHWEGVDDTGARYTDATPAAALYDPFRPSHGSLNLTANLANYSSRYGGSSVTVPGFYPARYYTWDISAADKLDPDRQVEQNDPHTLYEIRTSGTCSTGATCPTEFIQPDSRTDCGPPNANEEVICTASQELQNFANWFSYYRKRDLAAKAATGIVVANNSTARIGMATIHGTDADASRVASMNLSPESGAKRALLDTIYDILPVPTFTPLRAALQGGGRYFECVQNDIFGSGSSSLPGSANCPILSVSDGGSCQQNYSILMTDGFYNGDSVSVGNTDGGTSSSSFDGGAFADGWSNTLADVAMYYYERDLQTTLTDKVPPTANDKNRYPASGGVYPLDGDDEPYPLHQHMSTYTLSFGLGNVTAVMPTDPTEAVTWLDPSSSDNNKIEDLLHAAYNGRGEFYSADNPTKLSEALNKIFSEIGQSEGAASAVAFNTQNIDSGSLVFRAFFNTKNNFGDLVAHKVNLNGTIDTNVVEWSAAESLKGKSTATNDSRIIFTYQDSGATSTGVPFMWDDLTTGVGSQQEKLHTLLPAPTSATDLGDERLGWLRGRTGNEGPNYDIGQLRERVSGAGEKELLGDIVHSAPVFVGPPPYSGRDLAPFPVADGELYSEFKQANLSRPEIVYVGANDGMLHAFDANTGVEKFAYIPNVLFDTLPALTHPNYQHKYYVDLTPSVNDVYINGNWTSVLVGGLGKGGKGYYALDITNPASFATHDSASDNIMWEFTSADDNALGYSFSAPLIVTSNSGADGSKTSIAIFGNGYNSDSTDGDAYLFVVDLTGGTDGVWTEGTDYVKINTGYGKTESGTDTPNGIAGIRGIDLDQNGTVDYVYAGDLQGNLYRFDLQGNMADWALDGILYKAVYGGVTQPIINAPVVVPHPESAGFIVIFGTGTWMVTSDRTDESIQSLYGVWDDLANLSTVTAEVDKTELVQQWFVNHADREAGFVVRTSSNQEVDWKNTGSDQVRGWYVDFNMPAAGSVSPAEFPGERPVRRLQLRGGILFFNTVIPKGDSDPCLAGAGGWELGVCPETGGAPDPNRDPRLDCDKIIFDLDENNEFSRFDNVDDLAGSAAIVTGKRFDGSTPADSSFIGDTQVTQTSDKSIRTSKTNTGDNDLQGRHSWREVR